MKILSVDFDIIMAPDINLYNQFVPRNNLEEIIKSHPQLVGLRADLKHYQKLVNLLLYLSKGINYNDIYVAFSHENIGEFLKNENDLEVVNIDHHHDLGYDEKELFEKCTCANWAYYFFKQNKIKSYTWLNNANSDIIPPPKQENCFSTEEFCDITELNYIEKFGKPDKIFLCLSPEWVPEHYHPLFFLMLDLLNKQNDYTLPVYGQ